MMAIFFRPLSSIDKGSALKNAIDEVNAGVAPSEGFPG
jgi:hypothetical protein